MVGTIKQRDFDVDHRVTRDDTILQLLESTFLNRRHVFLRNHTTYDLRVELEEDLFFAFTLLFCSQRLDTQPHVTVLTTTTGLTYEFTFLLDAATNRFTVGNLRLTDVRFYLELATHTVNDDIQVQLAHTRDDGLAGLFVGLHLEGRIFLGQFTQRNTHFFLVSFRLRLYSNRDNRIRELHALKHDLVIDITQSVTCSDILQTDTSSDVACEYFFDLFARVGVHLNDTTNTLFLLLNGVINTVTRFQNA